MKRFTSEAEMARIVVGWLKEQRWEVYQEVAHMGRRADIVATRGPLVWAIETKLSLSLSLFDQVMGWRPFAHHVSMATPYGPSQQLRRILQEKGIGVLIVTSHVNEMLQPRLNRKAWNKWRLREEQKSYAEAGNANGRYYTSYRGTCDALFALVKRSPGISLKDAMKGIAHHYSSMTSACSAMSHWLRFDKVPGIRCEKEGRFLRLYLETKRPEKGEADGTDRHPEASE